MQLTAFDELASRNDSISKIHGAKLNLDGGATFCCNLFDGVGAAANSGPMSFFASRELSFSVTRLGLVGFIWFKVG